MSRNLNNLIGQYLCEEEQQTGDMESGDTVIGVIADVVLGQELYLEYNIEESHK